MPHIKNGIPLIWNSAFFKGVLDVIRTHDLPLRRRKVESASEFSEVPESRIKSHVFTGSNSPVDVRVPLFLLAVRGSLLAKCEHFLTKGYTRKFILCPL